MWKKTRKTCHSLSILGCSYSLSLFRFAMNDQSELYFIVVIKLVLLAVAVYYKCYRCQGSNVDIILNDITHYLFSGNTTLQWYGTQVSVSQSSLIVQKGSGWWGLWGTSISHSLYTYICVCLYILFVGHCWI